MQFVALHHSWAASAGSEGPEVHPPGESGSVRVRVYHMLNAVYSLIHLK